MYNYISNKKWEMNNQNNCNKLLTRTIKLKIKI